MNARSELSSASFPNSASLQWKDPVLSATPSGKKETNLSNSSFLIWCSLGKILKMQVWSLHGYSGFKCI